MDPPDSLSLVGKPSLALIGWTFPMVFPARFGCYFVCQCLVQMIPHAGLINCLMVAYDLSTIICTF